MTPKEERADAISAYAEHVKTIRSETSPGYTGHERTLLIIGFAAGWDDALRRQPVVTGPERTLRDEIAEALGRQRSWYGPNNFNLADAVLPVVQARIDAARAEVAEAIAQDIEALPHGRTGGTQWVADFDLGWRHCRMDVLDVVRQLAATEGPRP